LHLEDERWYCTCLFYEKAQLPCRHLLKVLICRGISILDYFSDRWRLREVIEEENNQPSKKRGREKASRRKLIF